MRQVMSWWVPFLLLILMTYLLQLQIYLNYDVIYLTHAAKQMLAGGTYLHDFFETNPPLIMFLYLPPVLLSQLTSISLIYTVRIYILLLIFCSMSLCYFLLQKLFKEDRLFYYLILYSLALILLLLPAYQLGQREHLMMIFTTPYLFAVMVRLENKPLSPYLTAVIGFLAGLGISLKPFFLTMPFLIEIYYIYKKNNLLAWIRPEIMAIVFVFVSYLLILFYFYTDYLQIILPFVNRVYFIGMKEPWEIYFKQQPTVPFCFIAAIAYLATQKLHRYPTINRVLFLALLGFIASFTIPRSTWYYHVLPAFGIACLLFILMLEPLIRNVINQFKLLNALLLLLLLINIFSLPITYSFYYFKKTMELKREPLAQEVFAFFNHYAPYNTFTCFSVSSDFTPIALYSTAEYVGPSTFFWWEFGFVRLQKIAKDPAALQQLEKDRAFIANIVTTNLIEKKPRFVLIDDIAAKRHLLQDIDYLQEFSQYKNFRIAWRQYHYLTTLGRYRIFAL